MGKRYHGWRGGVGVFFAMAMLWVVLAEPRRCGAQGWVGGSASGPTNWNNAANWSTLTVPNSTSAVVALGDMGVGTVNIASSVATESITFANDTGSYNLTSSSGQNMSGITSITVAANVTGTDTINLSSASNASLNFPSGSSLTFSNNSVSGGSLVIGPGTVVGTPGFSGVTFQGTGATTFSGTFSTNGGLEVNGGLAKNGPGSLDYSGNGASLTGSTTLNGGTLNLDFAASLSLKAGTNATLGLDNGILQLMTPKGGASVAQTYAGGTTINTGQTDVLAVGAGTVSLGTLTITRNAGGTVDFAPTGNFTVNTNSSNTFGLLGTGTAYATVGGGTTWATVTGGAIVGLPSSGYENDVVGSGVNTNITASESSIAMLTNSLRFNTGSFTFNLSSPGTLQSGGVLVTPTSGGATITGSALSAGTSGNGEFIFSVYNNGGLIVSTPLIATGGLTKTGAGLLTLAAVNTGLTGPININRSSLTITNTAAVNSASGIHFNDDRMDTGTAGLQQFNVSLGNNTSGTVSVPISLSAFSASDFGTYFLTGANEASTVTLSGQLTSAPGLTTSIRFGGTETNSSGFNLTNAGNSFTGNISVLDGSLGITTDDVLGNPANTLILDTENPVAGGLVFLNSGINIARPVVINSTSRIISNGSDSNTISGLVSGGANAIFVKAGTGTLTLANASNSLPGGITVAAGTLSLGTAGGFAAGTNLTVDSGAIFTPGITTHPPTFGTITLAGGTFRVTSGSLGDTTVNKLVTGTSGGTIDFTGSSEFFLQFEGTNSSITVNGNSTWLSPNNTSIIANLSEQNVSIVIPAGIILTDGIAFAALSSGGFTLTGGGTLFQNSDATNQGNFITPLTITQGIYRVTDISTSGTGDMGTGVFTLDGGTLSYGGVTATTSKSIALTANGGAIQVENPAVALTLNGQLTGSGTLTKIGTGTLILPRGSSTNGGTTLANGTLLVTNTVGSATGTGNVSLIGGTLGGSGIINGTVVAGTAPHIIYPSATLTGNTATALRLGGLTTNIYTTLAFNLKTPGASSVNDAITVANANGLTLNAGTLQINNNSTGVASLGYYKAIQYSGAIQGAGIFSITLPPVTNDIAYTLDVQHDPGFVDIHRGFIGDANDDGKVTVADYGQIDAGFLLGRFDGVTHIAEWVNGDFNGDGVVNYLDYALIDLGYQQQTGGVLAQDMIDAHAAEFGAAYVAALQADASSSAVPEPGALALLVFSALGLFQRRSRQEVASLWPARDRGAAPRLLF